MGDLARARDSAIKRRVAVHYRHVESTAPTQVPRCLVLFVLTSGSLSVFYVIEPYRFALSCLGCLSRCNQASHQWPRNWNVVRAYRNCANIVQWIFVPCPVVSFLQ